MLNPIPFIESSLQNYKEKLADARAEIEKDWNKISFLAKQVYNLKIALQTYYN